ncbi:MAG: PDGLE domain-containing protein [Candidatus Helarchaeota archaeon]
MVVKTKEITIWKWLAVIIVVLAAFLYIPTYIAGPDGLEAVFQTYGFEPTGTPWVGLFPDYAFPGISSPFITSLMAGIVGTLIVFMVAYGFGKLMVTSRP